MSKINENIYTSTKNGGYFERVGISTHYFDRRDERCWGFTLPQFVSLLDTCITYNPSYDELPENLSNQCIRSVSNKIDRYGSEHCFKLIPSEDLVVVLNRSEWNSNRDGVYKPKPYWWNDWVVVSMWRCNEGILFEEIKTNDYIKIGGRYIKY